MCTAPHDSAESKLFEQITEALAGPGWCVVPGFLSNAHVAELVEECHSLWEQGAFRPAGVGNGEQLRVRPEVRSDHVLWLDERTATPSQRAYLQKLEKLRRAINERLFLGLFEYEGHLAIYPSGTFYKKHLDQHRGVEARTVTAVLYLNEGWREEDGGHLRFYLEGEREDNYVDVRPDGGTLACFLSGRFYHEVLPARRERTAITGWFRRREP